MKEKEMTADRIILFIFVSVLIIVCAYYATYFLAAKTGKTKAGRSIKLRDRFAVTKDKSICLIEVKDKIYLIAMTNQNVTLLDTLELEAFEPAMSEQRKKAEAPKFEPQGILQKGLWQVYTSLKNGARPKARKTTEKSNAQSLRSDNDALDQVYNRIQRKRARLGSVEDALPEEIVQ
ncbi:MAG: flagellar biosynthetic protein FliO [Clostridiales bacterium]|nr:flagellar biosynthetic protein FliO [Clostridiales bacterium]